MATTTFQHSVQHQYGASRTSAIQQFFNWCEGKENDRLFWTGMILLVHGCLITPITVIMVMFGGVNMLLYSLAIVAITMNLVVNLAALPTKVTIPVFFLSILMDISIIAMSVMAML